jgi:hypothetical protein
MHMILDILSQLFQGPAIAGGSSRTPVVQPAPQTRLGSRLSRTPAKPAATLAQTQDIETMHTNRACFPSQCQRPSQIDLDLGESRRILTTPEDSAVLGRFVRLALRISEHVCSQLYLVKFRADVIVPNNETAWNGMGNWEE